MKPFVVLGTPRSRTAWLSKFLTYGDVTCFHEPSVAWKGYQDIQNFFAWPYTGAADSLLTILWMKLKVLVPDLRVVVVRRPLGEVVASAKRMGCPIDERFEFRLQLIDEAAELVGRMRGAVNIAYEELEHPAACAYIFEYLLERPFDIEWWERWRGENVQADWRETMRVLQGNLRGFQAMYGKHLAEGVK